jgi:hypothetical protein
MRGTKDGRKKKNRLVFAGVGGRVVAPTRPLHSFFSLRNGRVLPRPFFCFVFSLHTHTHTQKALPQTDTEGRHAPVTLLSFSLLSIHHQQAKKHTRSRSRSPSQLVFWIPLSRPPPHTHTPPFSLSLPLHLFTACPRTQTAAAARPSGLYACGCPGRWCGPASPTRAGRPTSSPSGRTRTGGRPGPTSRRAGWT